MHATTRAHACPLYCSLMQQVALPLVLRCAAQLCRWRVAAAAVAAAAAAVAAAATTTTRVGVSSDSSLTVFTDNNRTQTHLILSSHTPSPINRPPALRDIETSLKASVAAATAAATVATTAATTAAATATVGLPPSASAFRPCRAYTGRTYGWGGE